MLNMAIIGLLGLAALLLAALARSERRARRRAEAEVTRPTSTTLYQQGQADGITLGYERARNEIAVCREQDYLHGYSEAMAAMELAREVTA